MTRLRALAAAAFVLIVLAARVAPASAACGNTCVVSGGGTNKISTCLGILTNTATDACVDITDSASYAESVNVVQNMNGHLLIIGPQNAANHPTITGTAGSNAPIFAVGIPSVTIQGLTINPGGTAVPAVGVQMGAPYVAISSVAVFSGVSTAMVGVVLNSSSTVSYSTVAVISGTAVWASGGTLDSIIASTFTNSNGLYPTMLMQSASSSTVLLSYFRNSGASGSAAQFDAGSNANSIDRSMFSADSGVSLLGSTGTSIRRSTITANANPALVMNGAALTAVSQSKIQSAGAAAVQVYGGASSNVFAQSTFTGTGYAFFILQSSATTVSNCYIGGAGAFSIDASTATSIGGSVLSAPSGAAAWVKSLTGSGANIGVNLTSNTVTAPANRGFQVEQNTAGLIFIASNTINFQSTGYGVSLATAPGGTQVWVSSNTFLPDLAAGLASNHALEFNGLATGATVQFNSFYYRNSAGAAANSYSTIWAMSSPGLTIHHNRINQGGMIASGVYTAIQLTGSPNAGIKYNDLNVQAPAAVTQAAALVLSTGSTGVQLIGNAFNMSLAAAATATVSVDALSQSGFYANYNDYHSMIAPNAVNCAGAVFNAGGVWSCGGGLLDTNSMTFDPFWFNTAVLTEDFHPLSAAGRWNPGSNGFNVDATHSLTIDSGDPNDDFSAETAFNGNRMNIGSYAGTPEASKSVAAAGFPGCPTSRNVGVGQQYASINQAVASLPPSLTGPECVIIRDGGTYIEQVTVANFTNNGSTIAIFADPGTGLVPTVSPPGGSFAAFNLTNASVTVKGLRVRPIAPASYGVYASSPNVVLATMTVADPGGLFGIKGVLLSSYDSLSYSTVTAAAGAAVWVGGNGVSIDASSVTTSAGGAAAVTVAGSSNTISRSYLAAVGSALFLNTGSDSNNVLTSTVVVSGNGFAVDGGGSSSCTVSQSYLASTYGLASGGALSLGGNANVVSQSILVSSAANALSLGGATNTQVTQSTISAGGGSAVEIFLGAANNRFDRSTIFSGSGFGVQMSNVSSNTVSQSTITTGAGAAVQFDAGASYNVVQQSTMSAQTGLVLHISGAAWNTVSQSSMSAFGNSVVQIDGAAHHNRILASTMTDTSGYAAVYLTGASSSNTIDASVIASYGVGLDIANASDNVISQSSITSSASLAYVENFGVSDVVTQTWLNAAGAGNNAVSVASSRFSSITLSTVASGAFSFGPPAMRIDSSSVTTLSGNYVATQSTGIFIAGSTGTLLVGNVVAAGGIGVHLDGWSLGLRMYQNTLAPLSLNSSMGVAIDPSNPGLVDISTNVFAPGPTYQVYAATQGAGGRVYIASNTFLPTPNAPLDFYGLYLNGVTGAIVQNNSFYYRGSDGGGAGGWRRVAVYASSAPSLSFHHNRINEPGVVATNNDFIGLWLDGATGAVVKFNDFSASGPGIRNGNLLRLTNGATNAVVKNNAFRNDFQSATLNASTLFIDLASAGGLGPRFDFNDYMAGGTASNSVNCNGANSPLTSSWACNGFGEDGHSINGETLWLSTQAYAEDFHPLSQAGRWNGTAFVNDAVTAATIDAGDPAEAFDLEQAPHGFRVNSGSYGDTPEASRSASGACALTRKVCQSGLCPNRSIQAAVNSIPNPLVGYSCVLIEDAGSYSENVTVTDFVTNGSSMALMLDPALTVHPTLRPATSSLPGLTIGVASTTVAGIDMTFNAVVGIPYGILASSAGVTISSVNVLDPFNDLAIAGIAITTSSVVSYSTVAVATSHGIVDSGSNASVLYSSITVSANANPLGHFGLYVEGAASATVTGVQVYMLVGGDALYVQNSPWTAVARSTFNSAGASEALLFNNSDGVTVSRSYVYNNNGVGFRQFGGSWVGVGFSTVAANAPGDYAVRVQGANLNAWTRDAVVATNGGAQWISGSNNSISSVAVAAGGIAALTVNSETNLSVANSAIAGAGADGLWLFGAQDAVVSYTTMTANTAGAYALRLDPNGGGTTRNTVANSYIANGNGTAAYFNGVSSNTVASSTIAAQSASPAVSLVSGSSIAFVSDLVLNPAGRGLQFDAGSSYGSVLNSTVASISGGAAMYGLSLQGAQWTRVQGSVFTGGAWLDAGAANNTIALSTLTNAGAGPALLMQTASSNSVTQSYLANFSGNAVQFGGGTGCSQNTLALSVVVSSVAGSNAVFLNGASTNVLTGDFITSYGGSAVAFTNSATSNTVTLSTMTNGSFGATVLFDVLSATNAVTQSYAANLAGGFGAVLQSGADGNLIRQSTVYTVGAWEALLVNGVSRTVVSQSLAASRSGNGLVVQGAGRTAISGSTMNGGAYGLWVKNSSGVVVMDSSLQGSTAAAVSGSTGTAIGASSLSASGLGGAGLVLDSGSVGLTLSSSVVGGAAGGTGVLISTGNTGAIVLTTNTVLAGPQYGIFIGTQAPGTAPLYVSSNTILPTVTSSYDTCGLCLNGLASGGYFRNNSIYYRGTGSMGAFTTYGLYAVASPNLMFDHNRISNPGVVAGGGFVGAALIGSQAQFKFNDLYSAGSGLARAYGLQLVGNVSTIVKDNVFVNGQVNPATNYSVAVFIDAASQAGYNADYNGYYFAGVGNNSYLGAWGTIPGTHPNTIASWRTATGADAHSVVGDPLFASTAAGAEDFHLKTSAPNGRFDPVTRTFSIQDSSSSPAVDLADPSEPYADEPQPNGVEANAGSYGNTGEASKTAPPPGCGVQYTVSPSGGANYTSINQALAAVPLIGATLSTNTCIVITQSGVLPEAVDVYGINTNGYRLTIMGHPNLAPRAVVDPSGNVQAFSIQNDSVTIANLDIKPSAPASYGIVATSASLTVSNVNVDGGANISVAGISASSKTTISFTSVTVQNAYAMALSGQYSSVQSSTADYEGASAGFAGLYLAGASSSVFTGSLALGRSGPGAVLDGGAVGNALSASTIRSITGTYAMYMAQASSNVMTGVSLMNPSGAGLQIQSGAGYNAISGSTISTPGTSLTMALVVFGGHDNVFSSGTISGGAWLDSSAARNVISVTTITASNTHALLIQTASSNTVSQSYVFSGNGDALRMGFGAAAGANTIASSTLTLSGASFFALNVSGSSTNTVTGVTAWNPAGAAARFSASNANAIAQSSFASGAGGAYALSFQSGSSSNTLTQSFVVSQSTALEVADGSSNAVSFSTLTGVSGAGFYDHGTVGTALMNSYVQGSSAAVLSGSTAPVVGANVLFATSTVGFGLELTGGGSGLRMSSNVVYGGFNRADLYLDAGNSGVLVVSTNVFAVGSQVGVYIATQQAGTAVWFTSNTVLSAPSPAAGPVGLYLAGLTTGATIQNNAFLARTPGSLSGSSMLGIQVQGAAGLVIDHNRFSNPAMASGGGTYASVQLNSAPGTRVRYNDFFAADAANALTNAVLLQLSNSPNSSVVGNVFSSSLTVTGSSATLVVDAASQSGLVSDYNDYFSSAGAPSIQYGAAYYAYPWSGSLPIDGRSVSFNPRWPSTLPGAEDFHPLSQGGRWHPATQSFSPADSWSAGTIDHGDPSDAAAGETAPNGSRTNMGSYGGTAEASLSPATPGPATNVVVYTSSIAVSFALTGADGYGVVASTMANFSGAIVSSVTLGAQSTLAPGPLVPNTTYFFALQSAWGDLVLTTSTALSSATLADPPAPAAAAFLAVGMSSATLQWLANGNPLNVTTYTVALSTEPSYPNADAWNVALTTTPVGPFPSASFAAGALKPNTTYFAFASASNMAGSPTPYVALGSTATAPAAPASAASTFVAVTSGTLTVAWSANLNPVGVTTFTVVASTAADFNAFASSVTLSSAPAAGPVATLSGLGPNTTYHVQVRTVGSDGSVTAFVSLGSTATLAVPPATPALSPSAAGQIAASWSAPINPPGTLYVLQTSTSPVFAGVVTSSYTYNLFVTTAGLATNTTYYVQAAAINSASVASAFTPFGGVATLANAPASAVSTFPAVASSSMTVAWSANGNPLGTSYLVVLSTAADFNAFASSVSFTTAPAAGPSATFTGLGGFTTYYFEVAAVNRGGLPSVFVALGSTATTPPSLLPPAVQWVTSIQSTSLTATWGLVSGATGYTLVASTMPTNPPTAVAASSGPVGITATTATVSGLAPNTTYFLFVQADAIAAASPYAAFPATATAPANPLPAAAPLADVAFTSVTVSWLSGGNPLAMTTYTIVASTAADFNAFASSVAFSTTPAAGPQASVGGLFADTTYYFAVAARGVDGSFTGYLTIGSTSTLPAPAVPPALPFVSVSSDSFSFRWGANSNQLAVASYTVVASTAGDFNAFASSVVFTTAPAAGPSAWIGGLSPNTTYFVGLWTLGVDGSSSAFVVLGATATRAQPPSAGAFVSVTTGAIQASWTAPANPVGTLYEFEASTSPVFAAATSSQTYALAFSTGGLRPNTTYFFQVRAFNSESSPTAFAALGSTSTLAADPLPAAAPITMVGVSSVTVNWSTGGNPLAFTTYTITASTASDFNAFASSVTITTVPASGPSATVAGLAFGTSYYFKVAALGNGGDRSAYLNLGSTYTVLSNQVPLIVDNQGGDGAWRRTNAGVTYNVSFLDGSGTHLDRFQVKASTTPGGAGTDLVAFTDVVVGINPSDSYATPWSLPNAVWNSLLEGVTNYITVRVYNNVPSTSTLQDAFFVRKDTTPPAIVDAQSGDDVVRSAGGTVYAVSAADTGSGLAAFQYSVSTNTLGDASRVPWTDIATLNGATYYQTPWTVNFAALLSGVTNYVSVRSWDVAGATTTVLNAFYVLKDTVGPTVAVSSPATGTGFVSPFGPVLGVSSSAFPVQGTEVAVLDAGASLYWNPGSGLFNSGSPVWMAAVGQSTWSFDLAGHGIALADGSAYKIVARSSTTFNQYSTVLTTAAFVFDASTPTVGVQAPVPNSTIASLPVISGTSADPGAAPSGVSSVEVRLMRFSDGKWWNWFTDAWGTTPVSTTPATTASWSVTPSPLLQANLLTGASYFIAVRATDGALPANSGNFFTQGATFTFSNPAPPAAVSDLAAVSGPAPGDVVLTWTATGDHGSSGIILQGQYAVFGATYAAATPSTSTAQVFYSTAGVAAGAASGLVVSNLTAGVTYYFAIALQNTDGNWSAFSNQASTVATPAPLNAILGHVVDASTAGITGVEVDAWNSAGALVSTAFTLADGSGTFTAGGLAPGNYKLQASWTVNGVTSSVWQDNIAMGSTAVDFSLNINYALATLTGSLATLTTSAARTGTSPAALARPAAGSSFVEVAQRGRTITRVGVQPSGRWTVSGLLPGQYSVRAFTGVEFTDYQDVTLAEGETRQIGFVFDPLPNDSVFAFPNPAKDSTTFRFLTPFAAPFEAVIDVFDVAGRLVKEIPGSDVQATATPALYHASWDLTNSRGQAVASGVYLYVVKVKDQGGTVVKVVKKLAVVR